MNGTVGTGTATLLVLAAAMLAGCDRAIDPDAAEARVRRQEAVVRADAMKQAEAAVDEARIDVVEARLKRIEAQLAEREQSDEAIRIEILERQVAELTAVRTALDDVRADPAKTSADGRRKPAETSERKQDKPAARPGREPPPEKPKRAPRE